MYMHAIRFNIAIGNSYLILESGIHSKWSNRNHRPKVSSTTRTGLLQTCTGWCLKLFGCSLATTIGIEILRLIRNHCGSHGGTEIWRRICNHCGSHEGNHLRLHARTDQTPRAQCICQGAWRLFLFGACYVFGAT